MEGLLSTGPTPSSFDPTLINRPASKTSKRIDVRDYLLSQEINYGVILLGILQISVPVCRCNIINLSKYMVPSSPVPGSSELSLFHMNDGPDFKEKQAHLHCGM